MLSKEWAIDASWEGRDGLFAFCPVENFGEPNMVVYTGMTYLSTVPPRGEKVVGLFHEDGQTAAECFERRFAKEIAHLYEPI